MNRFSQSVAGRTFAALLCILVVLWGACIPPTPLVPYAGVPDYAKIYLVPVPGGLVNTAGGNLIVSRVDMSIDTLLGTQEIAAVYNSTSGEWLWNFQITFDGTHFIDPTGYVYPDIPADGVLVGPNGSLPGVIWVRVDDDTMKTKGGLAYHFGAGGQLAAISWATMDYPRIEFTQTQITQCTQAATCTPIYTLSLNANGDPLTITDPRMGRTAQFTYDDLGRLETALSPQDVVEGRAGARYEYSLGGTLLEAITNSEGERIEYDYQAGRRILHVTQIGEGNPRHRFEFYGKDTALERWPTVHINPLGGETRYLYDSLSRLREIDLVATGETTSLTYTTPTAPGLVRPSSITTPNGATALMTVDQNDDVVEIVTLSGNVITKTYDPEALNFDDPSARAVLRIDDSLGAVEERLYDAQGRVTTILNGEGEATSFSYGPYTISSMTLPSGIQYEFPLYGAHGHWLQIEGALADKRSFDRVGNVLATSAGRQEGGILSLDYDANRNLSLINLAATEVGSVISQAPLAITQRSDGIELAIHRPGGGDHDFMYDEIGRLIERREKVDGAWRTTGFEYDMAGNLTAWERPNGMREEFEYDLYGRRTRRSAFRWGALEGEAIFTYDSGELTSVSDLVRGGTEWLFYDAAGRLRRVLYPDGEDVAFEYDLRSRKVVERYSLPAQGTIQRIDFEYDLADRQVRVLANSTELLAERVFVDGQLRTLNYGNGLARSFTYDPERGSLSSTNTVNADGEVVERTTVTRGAAQWPSRYLVTSETTTLLAATREEYSFGLGGALSSPDRLVGKRVWGWADGEGGSKSFVYDELSNMQTNADGDTFVYNGETNRLLSATLVNESQTVSYTYDEAGFADSRNGLPIEWTATGRLSSHGPLSLEWDMQDRLISLTIDGITRDFSCFGGRVECDSATGSPFALDLGSVMVSLGSVRRTYRHLDFRGNVSFVSDENGEIVSHYRYSPYRVDAMFGSGEDAVSFAGRPGVGDLMLLGARIYDPLVGRFLSPDPIFQFINQYTYTLGNPVMYWDPDGAQGAFFSNETEVKGFIAGMSVIACVVGVFSPAAMAPIGAFTAVVVWIDAASFQPDPAPNFTLPTLPPSNVPPGSPPGPPPGPKGPSGQKKRLEIRLGPIEREGGQGGGLGGSGDSFGPPLGSCSPTTLRGVPNLGWVFFVLIPLQLLLGLAILRKRF